VPVAIIEGSQITAIRTAAASGLATRTLARADARTHGVFGAGVQAATHVEAIAAVRTIERVLVWTRAPTKAEAFAAELRERMSCEVLVTSDPAEAAASDIVTTATSASEPILRGAWLRPGSHVNVVGAHSPKTREVDDDVVRRCTIYVDLMQSAMSEAGDLLIPIGTGVITQDDIVGEIGQVLVGDVAGRNDATQITLYKSLGVVAQDLFAGAHVYRAACEQGVGSLLSL
jgi:ornithine cyclodeaminase